MCLRGGGFRLRLPRPTPALHWVTAAIPMFRVKYHILAAGIVLAATALWVPSTRSARNQHRKCGARQVKRQRSDQACLLPGQCKLKELSSWNQEP